MEKVIVCPICNDENHCFEEKRYSLAPKNDPRDQCSPYPMEHGNHGTKKHCGLNFFENPGFNFQKVPWFFETKENTARDLPNKNPPFLVCEQKFH